MRHGMVEIRPLIDITWNHHLVISHKRIKTNLFSYQPPHFNPSCVDVRGGIIVARLAHRTIADNVGMDIKIFISVGKQVGFSMKESTPKPLPNLA